jgi:hypothetical protein
MDMNDRTWKLKDRVRLQAAQMRLSKMERRRRDLDSEMERLRGELNAEREAREELSSLMKDLGSSKKGGGLIRLTLFGALGYMLGARAGRTRYEQIMLDIKRAWRSITDMMRGGIQVVAVRSSAVTPGAPDRADLPVG